MDINQASIDLIKRFEGWRGKAYRCPAGKWTIGYGHTSEAGEPEVHAGMTISKPFGEEILRKDIVKFADGVWDLITVRVSDNQFGALVSFAYNVGLGNFKKSSVLRVLNAGQYDRVPDRLALWNKGGGQVLAGLTRRRGEEGELFLQTDDKTTPNAADVEAQTEPLLEFPFYGEYGDAVERLQTRLTGLGYQVGVIDGHFGKRTRGAVLAFQADNGLVTDGLLGFETYTALESAEPREIRASRANASVTSLAQSGSRIADAAMTGGGAGVAVSGVGVLGAVAQFSGQFQSLKAQIEPVAEPFGGLSTIMIGGLLAVVGFMTWQFIRSGRARAQDHRTGKTS